MQLAKDSCLRPGETDDSKSPDFQITLEESVIGGLRGVLGESGLQMVLRLYPLPSLSSDPVRFHRAMVEIFKEEGANIIESEIARRLLEKSAKIASGRVQHQWFTLKAFGRRKGQVSADEKKVLKRFVALASLPRDHEPVSPISPGLRSNSSSIELTSLRFAAAFKK